MHRVKATLEYIENKININLISEIFIFKFLGFFFKNIIKTTLPNSFVQ